MDPLRVLLPDVARAEQFLGHQFCSLSTGLKTHLWRKCMRLLMALLMVLASNPPGENEAFTVAALAASVLILAAKK